MRHRSRQRTISHIDRIWVLAICTHKRSTILAEPIAPPFLPIILPPSSCQKQLQPPSTTLPRLQPQIIYRPQRQNPDHYKSPLTTRLVFSPESISVNQRPLAVKNLRLPRIPPLPHLYPQIFTIPPWHPFHTPFEILDLQSEILVGWPILKPRAARFYNFVQ